MKQPVRLHKVEEPRNAPPLFDNVGWMFIHPAAMLIALLIAVVICSALVFAVTGGSAVESGGMRNFIANI